MNCAVFRIIVSSSQPDPVRSTAQCTNLPEESCDCTESGVSFSQPTDSESLFLSTQLMGTPGTSQVKCLLIIVLVMDDFKISKLDRFRFDFLKKI